MKPFNFPLQNHIFNTVLLLLPVLPYVCFHFTYVEVQVSFSSFYFKKIMVFTAEKIKFSFKGLFFETISEALTQRCSVKKVFLEISWNSQENTCTGVIFRPATLLKKILWRWCFPVNFVKFLRTLFLKGHLWRLLLRSVVSWGLEHLFRSSHRGGVL